MSEFVPTFWNTLTQFNGRSRTSKVSAGQICYKKRGYAWDNINTDIAGDFTASALPGDIEFPRNAQDWLEAEFDGEYSAKRQVTEGNWQNSEDPFVMRMRADCPTNATGIIHPDKPWQVVYYNAFGQGQNLIYGHWHGKTSRLEHVIEITEMPAGDSEYLTYDFYIQSNDATTFVGQNFDQRPWAGNSGDGATVQGFSVFLAKGDDPTTIRGAVLRKPVCWWTNLDGTTTIKDVRVDVVIQPDGITVKATKYVRRSDIAEALAQGSPYRADVTFNPDPNPESTSVDGHTVTNGTPVSWATLYAASAASVNDTFYGQPLTFTPWDAGNGLSLHRGHYGFDTSSIGADQEVNSATLTLYKAGGFSNGNELATFNTEAANIYSGSTVSDTALSTADHLTTGSTKFSDTGFTINQFIALANNAGHTFTFNADGMAAVSLTGISKFSFKFEKDASGTDMPNAAGYKPEGFYLWFADNPGTTYDPLLTVTHSAAGPAVPVLAHHKKLSLRY